MPVNTTLPRISYTTNGVTKSFAFPFSVITASDIAVYHNGVKQTTGYSVLGSNGQPLNSTNNSSGSVTTVEPLAAGITVLLQRETVIDRTTDYVEGGSLTAQTLDADFDRIVMQMQNLDSVVFKQDGSQHLDAANRRIKNLAAPTTGTDAATKTYVDSTIDSLTTLITFTVQYSQITAVNGTFSVLESSALLFNITKIHAKTASGTVTATVRINGVPVTGMNGLALTSTQLNANAAGANVVQVGDRVDIVLASNVNAVGLSISLTCTKQQS